jgi:wyosine [tRNA(Phe)-imidazoG37] synthetase (radical SAM superfamily)
MKVCLVQSGGFVGAIKRCEVDTATLERPEAERVRRLVEESGLHQSGHALSDAANDLRQYELTIEDETRAICVTFDDQNVPNSARQLLGYLQKRGSPGR